MTGWLTAAGILALAGVVLAIGLRLGILVGRRLDRLVGEELEETQGNAREVEVRE
jgi:hypothetical protein